LATRGSPNHGFASGAAAPGGTGNGTWFFTGGKLRRYVNNA